MNGIKHSHGIKSDDYFEGVEEEDQRWKEMED